MTDDSSVTYGELDAPELLVGPSGSTPNLALPYPTPDDTVDVPRDVQALAMALDAKEGGGGAGLRGLPVLDVGMLNQHRAGRVLAPADFTSMGLATPLALWNLSDLSDASGNARVLTNKGAVGLAPGIMGQANASAQFTGSTAQALYFADTGAADPFRMRAGSVGCWLRVAKRNIVQTLLAKASAASWGWFLQIGGGNALATNLSDGATTVLGGVAGVSDVCDDRWHFAVMTFDGSAHRLYVDGALEALGATSVGGVSTGPLNVGAQYADAAIAATSPFYGRVDEAFVTSDVLSDDEVRALYATRLAHPLGVTPKSAVVTVNRYRKGAALAVADFTTQPLRLHNFTAGSTADEGSGNVPLGTTGVGAMFPLAGADGSRDGGYALTAQAHNGLPATDAGLPAGVTSRSYGCWLHTNSTSATGVIGWGTGASVAAGAQLVVANVTGVLVATSGADQVAGVYVADGQWHFAVVVEDNAPGDGVRRKLYQDGRLVSGSTVLNPITLAGANRFRVGAYPDGFGAFNGQVDGAFVCGYALTASDVARLYAKGAQPLGASPKNAGDHVERLDATGVLAIFDTLESQHTVDVGVMA